MDEHRNCVMVVFYMEYNGWVAVGREICEAVRIYYVFEWVEFLLYE